MKLKHLREEVCYCNKQLPKYGLVKMTSGNVSGRDSSTNLVVIKPSGIPYEELTPKDLIIVDISGKVIEGDFLPSVDTATHLYVYRHRSDVFGMAHTHSPYATSFAVLGQAIPPCVTTSGLVGGEITLGKYKPPLGEENVGIELIKVFGESLAVIMQNHGVFTIGSNASHATRVAVEVEEIAKISHLAMLRGSPITLSKSQLDELVAFYAQGYGQDK